MISIAAFLALDETSLARAQSTVTTVRVVNATAPDILSIPDARAFEVFLPQELPGTTASITYMPGASRAVQALLADEADVAIATLPSGLFAIESGQDLVAFSLASGARPYLHLVASAEIRSWQDLEGQDVAIIGPVDATHYLAQMQMREAGASPEKAQWRAVGGGAGRANALMAGVAKATMLQSGQALEMMARGPFHVIPPPTAHPGDFIFKVYWAKREFLRANPRLGEAIVRAHLRSVREALDKPRFVEQAVKENKTMPVSIISRAYDLVREQGVWDPDDALFSRKAGDATMAQLIHQKVLKTPLDFDRWATTAYVRTAVARLGAYR